MDDRGDDRGDIIRQLASILAAAYLRVRAGHWKNPHACTGPPYKGEAVLPRRRRLSRFPNLRRHQKLVPGFPRYSKHYVGILVAIIAVSWPCPCSQSGSPSR
jgi:hypothetical protein